MAHLAIDERNGLYYLHEAPSVTGAPTFVFVNALTGTTDHWEAVIGPRLRAEGFGTLSYNFRGQAESTFDPGLELTNELIVDDILRLARDIAPTRPILTGLSIGGLFAAQARAKGLAAEGIVLLNTLRRIGPRIAWVNDALPHYAEMGGAGLFMGATFPMLVNPEFLAAARGNFLQGPYEPLPPEHGHMNLMRNSPQTDWGFDWSSLDLPVLSITGLHDRVFRDADVIDELYAQLPDARREDWDDCGHLVPIERPEKLAESLIRFGRELTP